MNPAQRSDDPARGLRAIWLGPEGAWRWWFDATFVEWAVGFAAFWISFFVLWFVMPLGIPMVGLSLLLGRSLGKYAPIKAIDGHRNWSPRLYFGMVLLLCLLVFPSLSTWFLPLSWWAAFLAAFPAATLIVRWARPYIDHNRPLRYWFRTWHRVASGPRPRRHLAEAVIAPLAVRESLTDPDDDTTKLLLTVAAIDMQEVPVQRYYRVVEVEAMSWNSRSGLAATSFEVLAWLRQHGVPHKCESAKYRTVRLADGSEVEILRSADLYLADGAGWVKVPDGSIISRDVEHGEVHFHPRANFGQTHQPIPTDRTDFTGRLAVTEVQA